MVLALLFHAFHAKPPPRRGDGGDSSDLDAIAGMTLDDKDRKRRIRCPKCGWVPAANSRWMCSCSHVWNTFDTKGLCPACSRQWEDTQCPKCHQWSKHEEWYER